MSSSSEVTHVDVVPPALRTKLSDLLVFERATNPARDLNRDLVERSRSTAIDTRSCAVDERLASWCDAEVANECGGKLTENDQNLRVDFLLLYCVLDQKVDITVRSVVGYQLVELLGTFVGEVN
jgi:hypothetical protein